MKLGWLNINRANQRVLRQGIYGFVCIFCLCLASCRSESRTVKATPAQTNEFQQAKTHTSAAYTPESSWRPKTMIQDSADSNQPTSLTVPARPVSIDTNDKALELESKAAAARKKTISVPSETEADYYPEIPAVTDTNLTTTDEVNLPALDKPGMADELISVNFDQVDVRTVLKTIGDITGINFIIDDRVQGTVTVLSPSKIRLSEIYNFLESILEVKGYAAVPSGNLVKIVPRAEATKRNLQVRIGGNPAEIPESDCFVTQIIPLRYADATEVGQIVRPMLAADAHMATYPRTNSILITDTSSNIHHIARIIQKLDVTGSKKQVTVISLKYASAQVLSDQIARIIDKSKGASSQASAGRVTSQAESSAKILPDARTNALIVVANAQDTRAIEKLVTELDVQQPSGAGNVHVVYLKNAPAKETSDSLKGAIANLRITCTTESTQNIQVAPDEGTNALIITASAQDFEVISQIVEKLDIVREQVLVEMLIMEASEDTLKEIGVDWATLDKAVANSVRFFGSTNFGPRVDFVSGDSEGLNIGAWKGSGSNVQIGAILHALEKQSGVNILSTPCITTSNHHKAKIIVGENMPFVTQSRITETTDLITPTVIKSFEYKDVGIILEITPHISQGGLVRLEIDSEFTKLIENVTTASTDTPTTAKRQAQTVVSMNSGSTIVIGGLIRDDKVTLEKKIPLVGDIPLLGELFKYKTNRLQKTNLLIFITPHVLAGQEDAQNITEKKIKEMKPEQEGLQKKNGGTDN
ncbi:MAG: type II secretion system secretin GspD [Sedimentisphaerales bacterium]|nr:type II secretion system secretin GspD [Sedimentisphaerales bacterium]